MSVAELVLDGQKLYTHTSWFSDNQVYAWKRLSSENVYLSKLCGVTTVVFLGIVARRTPLVTLAYKNAYNFAISATVATACSTLLWYGYFKAFEESEYHSICWNNQCGKTPYWTDPKKVFDLSKNKSDESMFIARRRARQFQLANIMFVKPDFVMEGSPYKRSPIRMIPVDPAAHLDAQQ